MTFPSERHAAGGATPAPVSRPRRGLLRAAIIGSTVTAGAWALGGPAASAVPRTSTGPRPATPEAALRELHAGNQRWRTFHEQHPHETHTIRREAVSGQHPFAVVLGCIDSRVPPELVFDQGLGDLLTVRSAGQVLDEAVLGSVAYGVLELDIPLVVVLGHQSCGAVAAAVHADETGAELPAHIQYIAAEIRPAIDRSVQGDARIDATVSAQVRRVRSRLAAEPDLAPRIAAGRLAITGARYELTSQLVHQLA
ncbi:carbonic anhydrase [Streptomyces clavuligerus]|uniref:Carbonic anhydrase n=1 Tax=Streptomyces clavuligerus TaxID=1901 RepID=B5GVY9_STRCL|nr:carbonic anhydrase [Streptomyces clavuligerus]EDY50485.1 carbonic anhydrase [Streptomyces clavuligerus]EFG03608.1 Carbonic anhydrase [Streptomyces clavuligerus]MBY6307822.1 carbonic anhydrase [Streptomyces clavuligerus]QCS09627.1 carbonic anhydrase [Streptomyces clavuligerus]QPJ98326.1 carbonic anhydrase [Streptomyces clavuligerus]